MKILVLSDVVFHPIEKEINKVVPDWIVNSEFHEDLSIAVLSIKIDHVLQYDYIFIHSDQIFHEKPIEWQTSFYDNIINFCKINIEIKIVLSNSWSISYELTDLKNSLGVILDATKYYHHQFEELNSISNIFIFDLQKIIFNEGKLNLYNYSLGILYQMPYTKKMIRHFATEYINLFMFLSSEEKKVIVLDCDNTLWSGIIGEDGIEGIKCDINGVGILYYNFQQFLRKRKEDGFLLCLCSKNNEDDVKDAFEKKNMPLKWNDFTVKKINWNDKSLLIKEIANELNIGEESLIYIDDNLFELNIVREYTSIESFFKFTNDYTDFIKLTESFDFRRKQILNMDLIKTELYEIEKIRKNEETNFKSLDDFIVSLNIKFDIRINDLDDLERLSQLTEKTNQFNFNKRPFTLLELNKWINSGNDIYSLKVSDKFGDYGTVGLMLIRRKDKNAIIENYLMSCRALGKKIEDVFFEDVLNDLRNKHIILTTIIFKETLKNIPAKKFINKSNYASIVKSID